MESYIKKSSLIRDFRMQVNGKTKGLVQQLDSAFFETINRIFRKKPHDIKFHITKGNTLAFNMEFNGNTSVYLEYFINQSPSTIITIEHSRDEIPFSETSDLTTCLDIIEDSLVTTQNDSNTTNS